MAMNLSNESFYDILGVSQKASTSEIKQSFQKLVLQHHPDKQAPSLSADEEHIHQLLKAWKVLRDPESRRAYDQVIKSQQLKQGAVINEDVDLDDMDYDEETGSFSLPCRCSGVYTICETDMELGVNTASCDNCSLIIRVLYDVVEDD
ncbi:hypothetical protein INT43_002762 [Umbelopsis isabellina]|uniref:Diphthamide biosynthesis protein 4 n=1 Tax=Mortierella isabellina TaxID=91625 RepID=A0A8H7UPJ8_MORIS|nr:hypothetical protein INT43_002762 [Umbelopsis isabellina]